MGTRARTGTALAQINLMHDNPPMLAPAFDRACLGEPRRKEGLATGDALMRIRSLAPQSSALPSRSAMAFGVLPVPFDSYRALIFAPALNRTTLGSVLRVERRTANNANANTRLALARIFFACLRRPPCALTFERAYLGVGMPTKRLAALPANLGYAYITITASLQIEF